MTQSVIHNICVILANVYIEEVKALQAKAMADLQKDLAKAKASSDPLRAEMRLFLMSLIEARLRQGISQAKLAAKLGTQQPAIARIESGHGNPSLRTLLAIAKALDTDLMLEYKQ